MKKRVAFQTLGCKLNQFESDSLATQFSDAGYELVGMREAADAYIINTCTVTSKADRKSRNLMYQARRQRERYSREHGDALVVVTGCFAEQHREEIAADHNTYVVGNKKKHAIFQIVEAHQRGEILDQATLPDDTFAFQPARPHYRTRGTLKIQDGCDNYCTFCIIPFVRGGAVSRPHREVVADMRQYIAMGYREVVLTGVNISRYRSDGVGFSDLLGRLLAIPGDFRLRISSLEPDQLDERFLDLLHHPRMTPHLHLCLQSGSERILLQMRRQYTAAQYQAIVDTIRARDQHFNITTDIIVGFPSETAGDFAQSCEMVRRNNLGHVHIFPYAVRSGTRAARMAGQQTAGTIAARCKRLKGEADAAKLRYRESIAGVAHILLTESEYSPGTGTGRAPAAKNELSPAAETERPPAVGSERSPAAETEGGRATATETGRPRAAEAWRQPAAKTEGGGAQKRRRRWCAATVNTMCRCKRRAVTASKCWR